MMFEQFPVTSRYHGVEIATWETSGGRSFAYLKRRFVPPPERLALLQEHTVTQGERLDNITAAYLGDPEQFWQVCDANNAMHPGELTSEIGRKLRITLPKGVPGVGNA
jgi:hypothetical protein